ncbi:Zinc finger C2H2-type [Fusarium oxysporum f. sp. vasinfectum]|nr:Zinc finger C2H2-type [Fusarium oxysporum f. sp. vasinfectum]
MSCQTNTSTQQVTRINADKSSNRQGCGFSCDQCNASFNRLAHLRRHELTHGSEKPYNCMYCSLTSSRKDVIVRHTRNFHHGLGNRKSSGFRGRRRNNSHPGASRPKGSKNGSARASPATTTARGQQDRHSEGVNDVIEERDESPTNNEVDESQSSQANSLDIAMPSQPDMFPAYLSGSPLEFNASFMDPDLINPNLSAMFDLDALLADAQGLFGEVPSCNPLELPILALEPPIPNRPTTLGQTDKSSTPRNPVPNDNKCENAWANLTKYPVHILASLRFPSKYAVRRFVKAFFKHIAPHIPIIHEPTFDIATTPSPLLLAVMACSAVYLGEHSRATSMHTISVQLVFEHERMIAFSKADPETLTWMLQTYLLLAYFEIHCGSEGKRAHAFPHCVKLIREALSELQTCPPTTYKDWVHLIYDTHRWHRMLKGTGSMDSNTYGRSQIRPPVRQRRVAKEESSWSTPTEVLYTNDALDSIIAGQPPSMPAHATGELYAKFGKKMEQSLQVLDAILKARTIQYDGGLAPNPTVHCARSLLNSAFYHLYASVPLSVMKKILWSPASLDDPEIMHLLNEAISPELYQALFNAADQLRSDCRVGLSYIKKIAPIIFGPESAVGALEGCLLLCWYLQFAQSRVSQVESRDTLNALINESFAEVTDLQLGDHGLQSVVPLAVSAELLSDGSMWKWPSSVSQKLKSLIKKLEDSDTTIHVATAYPP